MLEGLPVEGPTVESPPLEGPAEEGPPLEGPSEEGPRAVLITDIFLLFAITGGSIFISFP